MAETKTEWLVKHYDQIIADLKESIEQRLAAERDKNSLHFKGLNDATGTIKDIRSTYVPMLWLEPKLESMQKEIDDLKLTRAELAGKASNTTVIVNYILTGILLLLTIIDFLRK